MGNAVLTWSVTAWEAVVSEYIAQSGEPLPDNIRVSVSNEGSALSTGDFFTFARLPSSCSCGRL